MGDAGSGERGAGSGEREEFTAEAQRTRRNPNFKT
jgi:hypothetical protein